MNKFKNIIKLLIILSFFFFSTTLTFAQEKINNFDVKIKINKDSSILVTETIKYDFGDQKRHGIYRDIPIIYNTEINNKSLGIEVSAIMRDGQNENYTTSLSGSNENIKIGKASSTIDGEHTYVIVYKINGAINYFDKYDELYWNITGNNWGVPIGTVSASIELPESSSVIQSSCYIGFLNSKEKCNLDTKNNFIFLASSRLLNPGEGITIAIGFPKGIVVEQTGLTFKKELNNTGFLPIERMTLIFVVMALIPGIITFFIMFFIWKKKGRDLKYSTTIVPEYEPPKNIKPTLVGSLVDDRVDFKDITAGFIYLAEQGFLKINKIEKESIFKIDEFEFELIKNDISNLETTEKNILNLFFGESLIVGTKKNISEFKKDINFRSRNKKVIDQVYQEMADRGFYEKNPMKARTPYLILGIVFLVSGFFFLQILLLPGLIILIFSFMMAKKTKLGIETKNHILGFKMFLSITEKDRIDFHNAPEKKPEKFMEFLPYAIALGVEKKWARQFEGMYLEQPSWYNSNAAGAFVVADFASHMSSFSSAINSFSSGGSGSGGGGFSGGGGGGGGGGSW